LYILIMALKNSSVLLPNVISFISHPCLTSISECCFRCYVVYSFHCFRFICLPKFIFIIPLILLHFYNLFDMQLSRRHCIINCSRANSSVNWLSSEKTNVSRTISVLIFRVLMYLKNQFMSYIGLPEFHVHNGALANGSCCLVSRACSVRPAS
jgi:hypothetical protein